MWWLEFYLKIKVPEGLGSLQRRRIQRQHKSQEESYGDEQDSKAATMENQQKAAEDVVTSVPIAEAAGIQPIVQNAEEESDVSIFFLV
ncbi:hypothetical protein COLO4_24916 [Corchorus olitorius]|uniref:Uncharacterized protein n=1 Tax=Corchorus olitorius TaxID=93759 RepID=A0A1R3I5W4_9ROSI|nr:hypothetical protein COLO4_24916 [Corchorus olitorius]